MRKRHEDALLLLDVGAVLGGKINASATCSSELTKELGMGARAALEVNANRPSVHENVARDHANRLAVGEHVE